MLATSSARPGCEPGSPEWLKRARRDFRFFCKTTLKIKPKKEIAAHRTSGALVAFEFNAAQEIVWRVMQEQLKQGVPIRLVVLKARQLGISTFFCAWIFWNIWRAMHRRAAITSFKGAKERGMQELQQTMQLFYSSLPDGCKPQLRAGKQNARLNKLDIFFTDRESSLVYSPAVEDALRGQPLDYALCTEVSSYTEPTEFFGGFVPAMTIGPTTTLVKESTPKAGYFESAYKSAKRREGGYRAIFIAWWMIPDLYSRPIHKLGSRGRRFRDAATGDLVSLSKEDRAKQRYLNSLAAEAGYPAVTDEQMWWRRFTIDGEFQGDEEWFNQEYPEDDESCFFMATRSAFKHSLPLISKTVEEAEDVFPDICVGNLQSTTYMEPDVEQTVTFLEEAKEGWIDQERRAGLLIFEPPKPEYTYVIGADVADDSGTGLEDDSEDDSHAYSVACVYCCNTRNQVAEWRGHIPPYDWGDELVKLGYFYNGAMLNVELNSIGRSTYDRISRGLMYPLTFRWPKFDEAGKLTKKEMWVTDARTKQVLIGALRYAIDKELFLVRSPGLRVELAGYTIKNGRYQPGPDTYADRIIAAALAWQCVEQTDFAPYRNIVYGSGKEPSRRPAAGQARIIAGGKEPVAVPTQLPDEFGKLAVARISDIWDGARL